MEQVALYLQDAHPIRDGIELVRYAESKGFDAVWQADSRLVRDAVVPMAAFAASTDRIKIGSGVIDIWTRNPARLASTFSTLDDLAPGRIICGLGAWWDPLAAKVRSDLRRLHNFSKNPARKFGVECVFSTEQLSYPDGHGGTCQAKVASDGNMKMDCASGFGAVTPVTATFGLVAASRVLKKIAERGARSEKETIGPISEA